MPAVLSGSRCLRPAQELLRVADDDLDGDSEEAETQERGSLTAPCVVRRGAMPTTAYRPSSSAFSARPHPLALFVSILTAPGCIQIACSFFAYVLVTEIRGARLI
jgi:hypothetical protein